MYVGISFVQSESTILKTDGYFTEIPGVPSLTPYSLASVTLDYKCYPR